MSINFSAAQLKDAGYLDFLSSLLEERGIDSRLIKIEITESLMLENEVAGSVLCDRIHADGMRLALDDFGTGYSSLARMAQLPMDDVKLDKSLTDEFLIEGSEGFVDDITHLVHGLGKTIVVEGVETEDQYRLCLRLGCDEIQGYYFSRPVAPAELAAFAAALAPAGSAPVAEPDPAPDLDPAPSPDADLVVAAPGPDHGLVTDATDDPQTGSDQSPCSA